MEKSSTRSYLKNLLKGRYQTKAGKDSTYIDDIATILGQGPRSAGNIFDNSCYPSIVARLEYRHSFVYRVCFSTVGLCIKRREEEDHNRYMNQYSSLRTIGSAKLAAPRALSLKRMMRRSEGRHDFGWKGRSRHPEKNNGIAIGGYTRHNTTEQKPKLTKKQWSKKVELKIEIVSARYDICKCR